VFIRIYKLKLNITPRLHYRSTETLVRPLVRMRKEFLSQLEDSPQGIGRVTNLDVHHSVTSVGCA
jgi:hypothetical protein